LEDKGKEKRKKLKKERGKERRDRGKKEDFYQVCIKGTRCKRRAETLGKAGWLVCTGTWG
jgi:hypothetical protein